MQGMMQPAPDSQIASQPMAGNQDNFAAGQPPVDPGAHNRWNGTVESDQGPITVKNGIAQVGNDVYFVSDDGLLVGDKDGGLVAVIINGKVTEPTEEILDQLRQAGKVE